MHIKERVPRVLAAVAGTARAMRRHKRSTLAAGVALLLVTPLLTGPGVDARRFMSARNRKQEIRAVQQSKAERRTR